MSFSPYPLKEIGEFLAHKPETSLHAHLPPSLNATRFPSRSEIRGSEVIREVP